MDDFYEDEANNEENTYKHHDHTMIMGKLRCYRKARITCRVISHVYNEHTYPSFRAIRTSTRRISGAIPI